MWWGGSGSVHHGVAFPTSSRNQYASTVVVVASIASTITLTLTLTLTLALTLSQAFIYLDEKGEGWLPLADFESALLLVLSPETDDPEELAKQVMMAPQVRPVRR